MFEFLLRTGGLDILGCQQEVIKTNNKASIYLNGINTNLELDQFIVNASVNSQSLVEGNFRKDVFPFETVYTTSGDYVYDSGSSDDLFISKNFPISLINSNVFYERKNSGEAAIFICTSTGQLNTGMQNAINIYIPDASGDYSLLEFYSNGQKLYSGESYNTTGSNIAFYTEWTGRYWALTKQTGILNKITSGYGVCEKFLEKNNNFYYNGMEQCEVILECFSGVNNLIDLNLCATSKTGFNDIIYFSL